MVNAAARPRLFFKGISCPPENQEMDDAARFSVEGGMIAVP